MNRAVIDTNVWLRALIKPLSTVAPIILRLEQDSFQVIYSQWLLDELAEKLELPRIRDKNKISQTNINNLYALLQAKGERVEITQVVNVCRDADDNHVIETALAGQADFVVTGDKDLLVLRQFEGIRFVTSHEFFACA